MLGNNPVGVIDFLGLLSCDELIRKYSAYVTYIEHPLVASGIFPTSEDAIMAGALWAAVRGGDLYSKIGSPYYELRGPRDTYTKEEYAWTVDAVDGGWTPGRPRTNGKKMGIYMLDEYRQEQNLTDVTRIIQGKQKGAHSHSDKSGENPNIMSGYGLPLAFDGKGKVTKYDDNGTGDIKVAKRYYEYSGVASFYMVSPAGRLYVGSPSESLEVTGLELSGTDLTALICCLRQRLAH
jgi:hypothetical protein